MADVEVSTQPLTGLTGGGHMFVVDDMGAPFQLPVADVEAAAALAATALQPDDVGSAAYADVSAFAPMAMIVRQRTLAATEGRDIAVMVGTVPAAPASGALVATGSADVASMAGAVAGAAATYAATGYVATGYFD